MRPNNFDIVRLLLAYIVVLVHSYNLSQASALAPISVVLSSRLAVECFFVISGFLIFASYERCATLREYATNRALRILPGYWLSTVFCLIIAFAHKSFHVEKFLLANLTFLNFLQPSIQGVFEGNPDNSAMNGALWTIKIEVMFYIAVPAIVWVCRRLGRDMVLWTSFVLSILYHHAFCSHSALQSQLPGQLSFFIAGTLTYYHLEFLKRRKWWLCTGAVLLFVAHAWTGYFMFRPLVVAVLVMAACFLLPHVEGPTRWGDFSYGTYIVHYPIVQWAVEAGFFRAHPWVALLLTLAIVAVAAAFSWNFVEKPALAHAKSRKTRSAALHQAPNYPPAAP